MFIVKSFILPVDRVTDAYTSKYEFEDQHCAMCQVGEMLQRGHVVTVDRPATDLVEAQTICYTLDMHNDPIADELINEWMEAKDE